VQSFLKLRSCGRKEFTQITAPRRKEKTMKNPTKGEAQYPCLLDNDELALAIYRGEIPVSWMGNNDGAVYAGYGEWVSAKAASAQAAAAADFNLDVD
jgi:hypothetical protein